MQKIKKIFAMVNLCIRKPKTFFKGIKYLFKHGPKGFMENFKHRADYELYPYEPQEAEAQKCTGEIRFSILMPVYNVEIKWLEAAISSVRHQNYENWELCIVDDCSTDPKVREYLEEIEDKRIKIQFQKENGGISEATNAAAKLAAGEYLVLMDNDDELAPRALYEFYKRIKKTDADILYSDQDIIDEEGKHRDPLHKPDWSYDLLLSQMYVGHLLGFRRSLFEKAGGFRSEYNGSQDYDLMLRLVEQTQNIEHIAKILYYWRALPSSTAANPDSKPYAQTAGLKAIQSHLNRVYGAGAATAEETDSLFVYDVRFHLKTKPLVSVIMPTKDHVDYLRTAIDTIEQKTTYPNYEILILNNNSEEEETKQYFAEVVKTYSNVRVEDALFEFNWSKLNNFGIRHAKGDLFIFMNNDMDVITPDWMERLAEKAMRKGTGVVGGLLLYEDGTIQHAGVIAGMGGWADHVFKGMKPVHYGSPFISPMVTRNVTAVTGACMAISRETIETIGNFDEHFIICGSDIEICIRAINRGYVNVYDPYVQLHHFESKSRDSYIPEIDFKLSYKMYENYHGHSDPYYNKCLDMNSCVPRLKQKN
ncbi:MAG: glycosyltransferase [Clostridiales bacterium]|nr:glycosyltransferase [Clostridiales bacterium]